MDGMDEGPGAVGSLVHLAPTLLAALDGGGSPTLLPTRSHGLPVQRIVLLVVDGLGWDQLEAALQDGLMPHLARLEETGSARRWMLETVFPAMTPAALASLVTGASPALHGILGQVLMLESGTIDVLRQPWPTDGPPPLAVPTLVDRLKERGLTYDVVLERAVVSGPFTGVLHQRVDRLSFYVAPSGLPVVVDDILARSGRGAVYVYWSALDTINHERGAGHPEWRAEMRAIDGWIQAFTEIRRPGTWLWITADHGHVPQGQLLPYFALRERLPWLPETPAQSGNGIGVHLGRDRRDVLVETVQEMFSERVTVHDVVDLWARGRWGPPGSHDFHRRIGDVLLWADSPGARWLIHPGKKGRASVHGGTTTAEMTVPWVEIPLF
jgi:hypothetical protein